MSTTYLKERLFSHDQKVIGGNVRGVLDGAMNKWLGVLPLQPRFAGRSFCTPGRRIRLGDSQYYPPALGGVGLDEDWICCTVPIVTGTIDGGTGKGPFREGEAHVITADEEFVSLQELIEEDSAALIGPVLDERTRQTFGRPTWPIVSKKFDNKNPIPHHLHWKKLEVYDINSYDNPVVPESHYHTTAMGLYPWVTRDDLLNAFRKFESPEYNGIRDLSPHVRMIVDCGFVMPNKVLHSPTNLCTHEVHLLMDEHFLAENITLDGSISSDVAFLACREEDYPKDRHGDWTYLVEVFDFAANQDPNFVQKFRRRPIRSTLHSQDEAVDAQWIVYGDMPGEQKISILRLILKPGATTKLQFDLPAVLHTNQGCGRVGGLELGLTKRMLLGEIYYERAFLTSSALSEPGGIEFSNSGDEDFVVTLDFPESAEV